MSIFGSEKLQSCEADLWSKMNEKNGGVLYELVEGRHFRRALHRVREYPSEAGYRQHGWTPLHMLCWIMHSTEGAEPEANESNNRNTESGPELHNGSNSNDEQADILSLAQALLEAHPSAAWDDGMGGETPLEVAAIHGSIPILKLLIDKHPSCIDPSSVYFILAWERAWRHLVGTLLRLRLLQRKSSERRRSHPLPRQQHEIHSSEQDTFSERQSSETMESFLLDMLSLLCDEEYGNTLLTWNARHSLIRVWDNLAYLLHRAAKSIVKRGAPNCKAVCQSSEWSLVYACLSVGCPPDLFRFAIMMCGRMKQRTKRGLETPRSAESCDVLTDSEGNTPLHLLLCPKKARAIRNHATLGVFAPQLNHVEFLLGYISNVGVVTSNDSVQSCRVNERCVGCPTLYVKRALKMTSVANNRGELPIHLALKRSDREWWHRENHLGEKSSALSDGHSVTRALLEADPQTGSIPDSVTGQVPFVLAAYNWSLKKDCQRDDSHTTEKTKRLASGSSLVNSSGMKRESIATDKVETLFRLLETSPVFEWWL